MITNAFRELHWLWKHDKMLPIPTLIFEARDDVGGAYYHPDTADEYTALDNFPDLVNNNGIIIISTTWPETIANSLAHEWRHHWQWFNGYDCRIPASLNWDYSYTDYEAELRRFFKDNITERDALWFSIQCAGLDYYEDWMRILKIKNVHNWVLI